MRCRTFLSLPSIVILLSACQQQCGREETGCNELQNKHEYSILQVVESDLRDRAHDQKYLVYENARDTDFTVIAFPTAQAERGYVTLLTNAATPPLDKSVPNEDFAITPETLAAVKAKVKLSAPVEKYMVEMAARSSK